MLLSSPLSDRTPAPKQQYFCAPSLVPISDSSPFPVSVTGDRPKDDRIQERLICYFRPLESTGCTETESLGRNGVQIN